MSKTILSEIWNKANILTFIGASCAIAGIYCCFVNRTDLSIIMLIMTGICDAFDGPIARRYTKAKDYGSYLDSLADIVSSGVLVVCIGMALGFTSIIAFIVYTLFIICGITRLAYYGINSSKKKYFTGVPITTTAIVIPIIYLINRTNEVLFLSSLIVLSILFVTNIKIKKPSLKVKAILSILGFLLTIYLLLTVLGIL